MDINDIELGQVVRMKGQYVNLTVSIDPRLGDQLISVVWFSKEGKVEHTKIPPQLLEDWNTSKSTGRLVK